MVDAPTPSLFAERVTEIVVSWAHTQSEIRGLALVGSHARGSARLDSDIDLIVLVADPNLFKVDADWLRAIAWDVIGLRVIRHQDEEYGVAWSRRVLLHPQGEVEFTFARPSWASIAPIDPGTRRVISDGCQILYDPDRAFERLCAAVTETPNVPLMRPPAPISFRPFREDDFPQLLAWLRAPHVARWWPVPDAADAVAAKYLPRIRGEEDVRMSVILVAEKPIGMVQISPADQQHAAGPNACSIDLLIGEEGSIGVGLGPHVIEAFVTEEVFGRLGFSICLADPSSDNQRSIRAFKKAGFNLRRRFLQDNQALLLMTRCRSEPSP